MTLLKKRKPFIQPGKESSMTDEEKKAMMEGMDKAAEVAEQ
jgi:hypothetical protein